MRDAKGTPNSSESEAEFRERYRLYLRDLVQEEVDRLLRIEGIPSDIKNVIAGSSMSLVSLPSPKNLKG